MKKSIIVLCTLLATPFIVAGGNCSQSLSGVSAIASESCKKNKIYLEEGTRLMWQDQAYSDAEVGAFKREKSVGKAGNLRHAKAYCSRLNYAGYSDWRLPTSDELAHVYNYKVRTFTYSEDNDFWSSTPSVKNKYYVVFPADSARYARSPRQSNFIRCMRCIANDR